MELKPADYIQLSREIEQTAPKELRLLPVSLLFTCNIDSIAPYLVVESAERGIFLRPWFTPFAQLEQQVLVPESPFYRSAPAVAALGLRLEEAAPDLVYRFLSLTKQQVRDQITNLIDRIASLVESIREHSSTKILLWNIADPQFVQAGIADSSLERCQADTILEINDAIAQIARNTPEVFVFDASRLAREFGLQSWFDDRLFFLGRIPFSVAAQIHIAKGFARWFQCLTFPSRKCLVIDLDNTIWGGVIGEDGMGGIHLGEDFPGNVFKDFQRFLLGLRDRGVLLAIASKNNQEDALEVLDRHPDCLLRSKHFSAMEIHWSDKASSLRSIAKTLNIGVESLAFFDDNPVEREWVRSELPEALVIDVPDEPSRYKHAVVESGAFERPTVSTEDRGRAEMYRQEEQRTSEAQRATSIETFLESLAMVASIGSINEETLNRCVQLLAKTNQFNLTTRRHTGAVLSDMIDSGAISRWIRTRDRFGDQGLVGLAIAVPKSGCDNSSVWKIDSFLLSCRVLQRGVETALLSALLEDISKVGGEEVLGEYLPTKKNQPAASFYEQHGFERSKHDPQIWRIQLATETVPFPDFITLETDE